MWDVAAAAGQTASLRIQAGLPAVQPEAIPRLPASRAAQKTKRAWNPVAALPRPPVPGPLEARAAARL